MSRQQLGGQPTKNSCPCVPCPAPGTSGLDLHLDKFPEPSRFVYPLPASQFPVLLLAIQRRRGSKMGYPDSFEGFMINDQSKWTEFKKQEVGHRW